MPGFLVNQTAKVECSHKGQTLPTAVSPKVFVGGQPVVTVTPLYNILGCPFVTGSGQTQPCVTGQWLSGATRVFAGGQPVVLQDSQSTCLPNGTPMIILSTQTRVQGV